MLNFVPGCKIVAMRGKKKILLTILGIAIINLYFLLSVLFQNPLHGMRVIFFDVGQGDASLIMTDDLNILIDGGPDKRVIEKLDKYLPFWDREIDIIVLTHPHADHVTGLISAVEKYSVNQVWMTGVLDNSPEYAEFQGILKDKKIQIKYISAGLAGNISTTARIEILYPRQRLKEQEFKNLNNTSIVLKIDYRDKSFLFTGDIEKEVEEELCRVVSTPVIAAGQRGEFGDSHPQKLTADVLKIAHHGSANSSSQCFLEAVASEFAVISVGGDNDFGMPSLRILKRLERMGIKVFRTDMDGDVIIETDGNQIVSGIKY